MMNPVLYLCRKMLSFLALERCQLLETHFQPSSHLWLLF